VEQHGEIEMADDFDKMAEEMRRKAEEMQRNIGSPEELERMMRGRSDRDIASMVQGGGFDDIMKVAQSGMADMQKMMQQMMRSAMGDVDDDVKTGSGSIDMQKMMQEAMKGVDDPAAKDMMGSADMQRMMQQAMGGMQGFGAPETPKRPAGQSDDMQKMMEEIERQKAAARRPQMKEEDW